MNTFPITLLSLLADLVFAAESQRPYATPLVPFTTTNTSQTLPSVTRRPFTTPLVPLPPLTSNKLHSGSATTSNPKVPANTNSPKAPLNVAYIAYGYQDQWAGNTDTSKPPIDILPLAQRNSTVDALFINPCSLESQTPSAPSCHGWPFPVSQYWTQIWPMYQEVQAQGILLSASFGGFGSDTFHLLAQDWEKYYPPIPTFLRQNKFDGIDLDIEPSFENSYVPHLSLALQLVNSLRNDMGPEFLITLCPIDSDMYEFRNRKFSGFSTWELDQYATTRDSHGNAMKSINFFTPQFYEGGGEPSVGYYEELIGNGGWDPRRVAMLVLTSHDYRGYMNLSEIEGMAKGLRERYGDGTFGGVGGYEYARAGETDGVERWEWYEQIGEALGLAP
ncbi:glycoside hydrolase family 18 [Lecanosticta acicola]|uniref:Glycoside hydrolase family 18 n=1 Tax=Lecanosticta acicola TaxID=111012 RepID=A0AAI9EBK0_9PEZI|nr:glycoside hydrolase family 18 [Lecanosticta acicola]